MHLSHTVYPKSGLTCRLLLPHMMWAGSEDIWEFEWNLLSQILSSLGHSFHFHIITGSCNCKHLETQLDCDVQDSSLTGLEVGAGSWLGAWVGMLCRTSHVMVARFRGQAFEEGGSRGCQSSNWPWFISAAFSWLSGHQDGPDSKGREINSIFSWGEWPGTGCHL